MLERHIGSLKSKENTFNYEKKRIIKTDGPTQCALALLDLYGVAQDCTKDTLWILDYEDCERFPDINSFLETSSTNILFYINKLKNSALEPNDQARKHRLFYEFMEEYCGLIKILEAIYKLLEELQSKPKISIIKESSNSSIIFYGNNNKINNIETLNGNYTENTTPEKKYNILKWILQLIPFIRTLFHN